MEKMIAGNFSMMKNTNTNLILQIIREKAPIARTEIAREANLTPATVTNITAELLQMGLIAEGDRGLSSGGRKPVMLVMDTERYCIAGAQISSGFVKLVLSRLDGMFLEAKEIPIDGKGEPEWVVETLTAAVKEMGRNQELEGRKLLGIGIGIHGLVDVKLGKAVFAPNLDWHDIPFQSMVEERLGLPVIVDNDVKAAALGESWYGTGRSVSDFICINVDYGVGGSICIGGQIYRGINGGAGEVGHTTIEKDGPWCSCGNRGCLQSYVSENAIMENYRRKLAATGKDHATPKSSASIASVMDIYRASRKGNATARRVIVETGEYLGIGVANVVNTLNPGMIILTGSIIHGGSLLLDTVKEVVRQRSLYYSSSAARIVFSALEDAPLVGSVALVLRKIFQNPWSFSTLQTG